MYSSLISVTRLMSSLLCEVTLKDKLTHPTINPMCYSTYIFYDTLGRVETILLPYIILNLPFPSCVSYGVQIDLLL